MNPENLENLISTQSANVLYFQAKADCATCAIQKGEWRDEARRAANEVAHMVSLRSPETVARMESERGLA